MNKSFDVCGKCGYFTENPKADKWTFEGFCDNKAYSKRFKINRNSESCNRGIPKDNPDNSKIPDKIPERGEIND